MAPVVPTRRREAGFSLAEMVISLFVLVIILVAVLTLFDSSNKIAKAQVNVAEMQQSIRVAQDEMVRLTRMSARGGLVRGYIPSTVGDAIKEGKGMTSLAVRNNVAAASDAQKIAIGYADTPLAMPGTDVLIVRGVFNAPLYQLNPAPGAALTLDDDVNPTRGSVTIENPQPTTGMPQDLAAIRDAITRCVKVPARCEPIILASPAGSSIYAVVEIDGPNSNIANPDKIVVGFRVVGGTHTLDYNRLDADGRADDSSCVQPPAGGKPACFPDTLRSVSQVGLLEEYRYYVRQVLVDPANPASEAKPRLSRARMLPGTELPFNNESAQLAEDIADDILDLQVALAIDRNADNLIAPEDKATGADEWLYNSTLDDPASPSWNGDGKNLFYARITTLARTAGRDFQYTSPPITPLTSPEDHIYDELANPPSDPNASVDLDGPREYRRRVQQTVVDLRNL